MGKGENMMVESAHESSHCDQTSDPQARERLDERGVRALSDLDLVMILLGTGMKGKPVAILAEEVLHLIDHEREKLDCALLRKSAGVGKAKASTILASLELGRRIFGPRGNRISSPGDFFPLVRHRADRKQECFVCASLNGAHEVIGVRVISKGLVNRTMVHPREVFADAITDRACAVAVAHNHPSGRLDPSPEDMEITRKLKKAGDFLGIPLLDHIVFSESGYFSFVEHGLLDPEIQGE